MGALEFLTQLLALLLESALQLKDSSTDSVMLASAASRLTVESALWVEEEELLASKAFSLSDWIS